jgi:hypothetical protein
LLRRLPIFPKRNRRSLQEKKEGKRDMRDVRSSVNVDGRGMCAVLREERLVRIPALGPRTARAPKTHLHHQTMSEERFYG